LVIADGLGAEAGAAQESFYPPAAVALGIPSERMVIFRKQRGHTRSDFLWAIDQALRSGAIAAVVAEIGDWLDPADGRRLQLAAEIGGAIGLLVRPRNPVASAGPARGSGPSGIAGSVQRSGRPPRRGRVLRTFAGWFRLCPARVGGGCGSNWRGVAAGSPVAAAWWKSILVPDCLSWGQGDGTGWWRCAVQERTMRRQRWLAVWLDNWPIQRRRCGGLIDTQQSEGLANADPREPGQTGIAEEVPLLLWNEDSRRGRRVTAACEVCQRLGIHPHMPLHEAVELASRATAPEPHAQPKHLALANRDISPVRVERDDPRADRQALGRLADRLLLEISPLVAIEPVPERAPWAGLRRRCSETLLINVTGIGDWFGSEQAVLSATERLLEPHRLRAVMVIADTSAAAWGLVRFGRRDRLLVPPGQTGQAIDPLPIGSLRITAEVAHQLDRLGIQTVGQLRRLPRSGLATRLGSELVRRMDQMFTATDEPLVMHHRQPEDAAVCELEYPTSDMEILRHRIGQLIDTLAARLASGVRGALRLSCRLDVLEDHSPLRIDVGLFAPTADAGHLRRLMITSLEGKRLPAMVQRVSVSVDLSGPLQQFQGTLFGEGSVSDAAARRGLARMIETVAMRLGEDAVVGVSLSKHSLPEAAYTLRPLAGQSHPAMASGTGSARTGRSAVKSPRRSLLPPSIDPLPSDPLRRPLRLFAQPLRIAVVWSPADGLVRRVQIGGRSGDRRPGRIYRVLQCWGPERIETGTAANDLTRRDYYRVEVEGGAWFWLFRQRGQGPGETWYLHGRFD
jgi:protein ImuB